MKQWGGASQWPHGFIEMHHAIISRCELNAPKAILICFYQTHHTELPVPSRKQISGFTPFLIIVETRISWGLISAERTQEELCQSDKDTFNEDTAFIVGDIDVNSDVLDFVISNTTDWLVKLDPSHTNVHGDDTHKVVVWEFSFQCRRMVRQVKDISSRNCGVVQQHGPKSICSNNQDLKRSPWKSESGRNARRILLKPSQMVHERR